MVVTVVVMLFFLLVAMIVWVGNLGTKTAEDEQPVEVPAAVRWRRRLIGLGVIGALIIAFSVVGKRKEKPVDASEVEAQLARDKKELGRYGVVDGHQGDLPDPDRKGRRAARQE